jgi:hypothetical protein
VHFQVQSRIEGNKSWSNCAVNTTILLQEHVSTIRFIVRLRLYIDSSEHFVSKIDPVSYFDYRKNITKNTSQQRQRKIEC